MAAIPMAVACSDAGLNDILTPLPPGQVVMLNGSLSEVGAAAIFECDALVAVARLEQTVLPGDRWITELPGGCYRLAARAGTVAFDSKPFDLPPSGAYRVVVRSGS